MTITSEPWSHPHPDRCTLRLVMIDASDLHSLARAGTAETAEITSLPLTAYLGRESAALWRRRSRQIADHPADAPWVTRWMLLPGEAAPVGVAGFHGPPDGDGMVEVGYRVDPAQRRKGYARQALEILLATARDHPDVRIVRATVSPDNRASRALIEAYGFVEVGEQWDDEDGLEIILELTAATHYPAAESGS